ncbi:MAG: hypothetical protein MI799_12255, partial [Desulfobacterales bacterium]|nr:hypothetical protein [Desulfobacterales bacterium]
EKRVKWLTIKSGKSDDPNRCLAGQYEKTEISFPGMERFCSILTQKRINALELNTHLESNQIIETMLILLWVLPVAESCGIKAAGFWTWNRKAIAGGMLTNSGFHRFCADMKLDLVNRVYKVDYTYCELFMAKLVKKYALVFSSFSDHRAYFSLAPVTAIAAFVLFSLPVILMLNQFEIWTVLWLPAIVLPPVAVWLIMHVFGAMQYDMEHRNHLLDEYTRREKVLARFPEVNPNPIYKVSKRGEIVYVNPAAAKLLENAQISKDKIESVLPVNYLALSEKSLVRHEPLDVEFTFGEKVFRYLVSPFIEDQTVLFAGNDITYLRKIETELLDINANLESLVRQRTKEVELTQDATITCLASLAEVRDPETGEHIERTRTYVKALAVHLKSNPRYSEQLDDRTIALLFNSAPL